MYAQREKHVWNTNEKLVSKLTMEQVLPLPQKMLGLISTGEQDRQALKWKELRQHLWDQKWTS